MDSVVPLSAMKPNVKTEIILYVVPRLVQILVWNLTTSQREILPFLRRLVQRLRRQTTTKHHSLRCSHIPRQNCTGFVMTSSNILSRYLKTSQRKTLCCSSTLSANDRRIDHEGKVNPDAIEYVLRTFSAYLMIHSRCFHFLQI